MKFLKYYTYHTKDELDSFKTEMGEFVEQRYEELEKETFEIEIEHEGQKYYFGIFSPNIEKEFTSLNSYHSAQIIIEDLTTDALLGFYGNNKPEIKTALVDTDFQDLLKVFISQNSNTDIVLEKISKYGMDSLTEVDRNFLK